MIYPMKLTAPLKDYIWGGTRLKTEYGKKTSLAKVAESWELACRKDEQSIIASGPDRGMTLEAYIAREGANIVLGSHGSRYSYFPLLVKLIDAHDDLSVQVHPNDAYAFAHEGEYGKTEMWYIIDAEPGAELIHGFRKSITREECRRRIEDGSLMEVVKREKVKAGDVVVIPSGTLHAVGKGVFLASKTPIRHTASMTMAVLAGTADRGSSISTRPWMSFPLSRRSWPSARALCLAYLLSTA